jgi:hypothetical protein
MARNQPDDFYDDDDPGYRESGTHSGSSTPSPSTYSTSTPSSPAAQGTLGANGLTSADMDLSGMGESAISDAGTDRRSIPSTSPAQEAARAAQQSATHTKTRRSSDAPSPTSMQKKRGNQPT